MGSPNKELCKAELLRSRFSFQQLTKFYASHVCCTWNRGHQELIIHVKMPESCGHKTNKKCNSTARVQHHENEPIKGHSFAFQTTVILKLYIFVQWFVPGNGSYKRTTSTPGFFTNVDLPSSGMFSY